MTATKKYTPSVLWHQADTEHPDDQIARRGRYLQLMREHGFIVDREPGDRLPLLACGYDPRARAG